MQGKTHAIVGANAVWITALAGQVDQGTIFLIVAGALAGLLPDIDADQAKIHYIGGGVLGMFKGNFIHRGFFHSWLAVLFIFIISTIFLTQFHPWLPIIITLAYLSHPILDGLTKSGVRFLFPLKKFKLLPKKLGFKISGQFDNALFVIGALLLATFILIQYYPLLSNFNLFITTGV